MVKFVVLKVALAAAVAFGRVSAQLTGYATLNGGTTGGAGGSSVTVTSKDAFINAVKGTSPKIVYVSGIIDLGSGVTADIGDNTSVIGVGSNSGFTNGGLRVKKAKNVIIRNLKISHVPGGDCIGIESSSNVWVDHNELSNDLDHDKDYYDGLLDVKAASDFVTISWNHFHDHWKGVLIGHSDSATSDKGHLTVTLHHNWFSNVNSRGPSLRFGSGHIYNNLYENIPTGAVHSRMGANTLVENNVFRNVVNSIRTTDDSKEDGYVNARGSLKPTPGLHPTLSPDSVSSVINAVKSGAGVGKVSGGGGSTGGTTTPPRTTTVNSNTTTTKASTTKTSTTKASTTKTSTTSASSGGNCAPKVCIV
ncbi:hypothetical protein HK097_008654 [Rhizophlyctis rosea]|uniref:Pectate lyase domain-containing protein n=1 Tax=Rhizophlyctis rosea TaxID=64517 RepID=A0AAD5SIZ9_9FUNG|nr:hypothetical protein HK097_008654 [Rhizophlyctis rosea]